jgi:hypothetical protein
MKPKNLLDRLCTLRDEIAGLRAVKCHMFHERVIREADSMLPVVYRFPVGDYQRIGLCSPGVRSQRLGCSHTTARIKLGNAIDELHTEDAAHRGPGHFLAHELNWLNNEIHLLDHRKGDAEKALAKVLEETHGDPDRASSGEKLMKAEEHIRELERLHDEYIDRIGALRDRVVTEIDKLIGQVAHEAQSIPGCKDGATITDCLSHYEGE